MIDFRSFQKAFDNINKPPSIEELETNLKKAKYGSEEFSDVVDRYKHYYPEDYNKKYGVTPNTSTEKETNKKKSAGNKTSNESQSTGSKTGNKSQSTGSKAGNKSQSQKEEELVAAMLDPAAHLADKKSKIYNAHRERAAKFTGTLKESPKEVRARKIEENLATKKRVELRKQDVRHAIDVRVERVRQEERLLKIRSALSSQTIKLSNLSNPRFVTDKLLDNIANSAIRKANLRARVPQILFGVKLSGEGSGHASTKTSYTPDKRLISTTASGTLSGVLGTKINNIAVSQKRLYESYIDSLSEILNEPNMPSSTHNGSFGITARMKSLVNTYDAKILVNWKPLAKYTVDEKEKPEYSKNYWKHTGRLSREFKKAVNSHKATLKTGSFMDIKSIEQQVKDLYKKDALLSGQGIGSFGDNILNGKKKIELNFKTEIRVPGWTGKDSNLMDDLITKPYAGVAYKSPFSYLPKATRRATKKAQEFFRDKSMDAEKPQHVDKKHGKHVFGEHEKGSFSSFVQDRGKKFSKKQVDDVWGDGLGFDKAKGRTQADMDASVPRYARGYHSKQTDINHHEVRYFLESVKNTGRSQEEQERLFEKNVNIPGMEKHIKNITLKDARERILDRRGSSHFPDVDRFIETIKGIKPGHKIPKKPD